MAKNIMVILNDMVTRSAERKERRMLKREQNYVRDERNELLKAIANRRKFDNSQQVIELVASNADVHHSVFQMVKYQGEMYDVAMNDIMTEPEAIELIDQLYAKGLMIVANRFDLYDVMCQSTGAYVKLNEWRVIENDLL